MDWSSVFEDVGEGEGDWDRDDFGSARTGILASLQLQGKYGPVVCYAFTVNYILGVGCLGIPYAFLQSGIILGVVLILLLSFVSYITVMWIAVATQQEMQLRTYLASDNPFLLSPQIRRRTISKKSQNTESSNLLPAKTSKFLTLYSSISQLIDTSENENNSKQVERPRSQRSFTFKRRKSEISNEEIEGNIKELEVIDLASEFLGSNGKVLYQTSLMLLTYIGLLAYTQVFNSSFKEQIWPSAPTFVPQCIFGCIVVPLSCFDLSEQVTVQIIMSILRFLSLGILLFGTIAALILDPPTRLISNELKHISNMSTLSILQDLPLFEWSGFGVMFTTAIFSQLFQHSVPGLIRPLSAEDKRKIPTIFMYALCTTAAIYISTGIVCVAYFKDNLNQSVNLNFVGFTWGVNGHGLIVSAIAMIVVLFPAMDTLSVFPLIANTLGNNLNAAFPNVKIFVKWFLYERSLPSVVAVETQRLFANANGSSSGSGNRPSALTREQQREQSEQVHRSTTILWRLTAAVPPIIASSLVTDLIFSLQVAGLCGIVVALVTPALLQRKTAERLSLIPLSLQSGSVPFNWSMTGQIYAYFVLILAGVAAAISMAQML